VTRLIAKTVSRDNKKSRANFLTDNAMHVPFGIFLAGDPAFVSEGQLPDQK